MRNDCLYTTLIVRDDPAILVNVFSSRVKQSSCGNRLEAFATLSAADRARRHIAERMITYHWRCPENPAASATRIARSSVSVSFSVTI